MFNGIVLEQFSGMKLSINYDTGVSHIDYYF
jgi:hypothetical protein